MHVDVRKVLYRVQEYFWRTALLPVIDFLAVVIWYEGQSYEGMFLKKKFKYFLSRSLFYLDKLTELFARDIISDNTNEVIF